MKNFANLLAVIGVLLVIYSILGRFIGGATIGLGIIEIQAASGLLVANSILLISLLIKLTSK